MKKSLILILQFFLKNGKKKILLKQFEKNFYLFNKQLRYKDINKFTHSNWKNFKLLSEWFKQNKAFIFFYSKITKRKMKRKQNNTRFKLKPLFSYKQPRTSILWLKNEINFSSKKRNNNLYSLIFNGLNTINKLNSWSSKSKLEHYDLVKKNTRFKRYNKYKKFKKIKKN